MGCRRDAMRCDVMMVVTCKVSDAAIPEYLNANVYHTGHGVWRSCQGVLIFEVLRREI